MKKPYFFLALFLSLIFSAQATPWVIAVNRVDASLSIVDLGSNPPKIYGPFFQGRLGDKFDELLDVAVTPDGRYAVVTNFGERTLFKIDLTDPTNPILAGAISDVHFWPEDVAISPEGQFAVFSDGMSPVSDYLGFVNIASFSGYSLYEIRTRGFSAQAVTVAPDRTVIAVDYAGSRVLYGKANTAGTALISERVSKIGYYPYNAAVSPDGTTVLLVEAGNPAIRISAFDAGGSLVETGIVSLEKYPQSVVFSPDGRSAYAKAGGGGGTDRLYRMAVTGPGQVVLLGKIELLSNGGGGGYFGVDVIGITPDGRYAVIGFHGTGAFGPDKGLQLVDLASGTVNWIPTGMTTPVGVACFEAALYAPINATATRLNSSYIFYKEAINRLTWQANPENFTALAGVRLYRKLKTAADSAFQLLAALPLSVLKYDDRGLDKNAAYTYRLTTVGADGRESAPITFGN